MNNNENFVAIERRGPGDYQLLELRVGENYEVQSSPFPSHDEIWDCLEGCYGNDYKHVTPQEITNELAARQQQKPA